MKKTKKKQYNELFKLIQPFTNFPTKSIGHELDSILKSLTWTLVKTKKNGNKIYETRIEK